MPTTPILGITQLAPSQSSKEVTINDAILALEGATNAKLDVDLSAGHFTLTETEATRYFIFRAEDAAAPRELRFPITVNGNPTTRLFSVRNDSGFELTVKFASGAGDTVAIPDGESRLISALDGLDMIQAAEPGTAVTFLALSDTPASYTGEGGRFLVVNVAENELEFADGLAYPSFTDNAGFFLVVNGTEDGVEWIDPGLVESFTSLDDVPASYTGHGEKLVAVNAGETGLEFIDPPTADAVEYIAAERWRIFVVEPGEEAQVGYGEIEFLDLDDIDLTGSGTESASNFDTGFEAEKAFDDILTSGTGWMTEDDFVGDAWIEYDFGTAVTVRKVRLHPITSQPTFTPARVRIEYWDGDEWVSLGDRTAQPWVSEEPQTFLVNGVPLSSVADAPADGEYYVRRNNAWEELPDQIEDAPADGEYYVRRDNAWEELPEEPVVVSLLVSDPNGSALTIGDGKVYWRVPSIANGMNLTAVAAALSTTSSSGTPTIQIHNVTQAADMLTTSITIDSGETDSSTAAVPAVIDATNDDVATANLLRIDIDVAGTGAKGLIVELRFESP